MRAEFEALWSVELDKTVRHISIFNILSKLAVLNECLMGFSLIQGARRHDKGEGSS